MFKEASNLMKKEEELKKVHRLIVKGLFYDPNFHAFYALKGDIHLLEGF